MVLQNNQFSVSKWNLLNCYLYGVNGWHNVAASWQVGCGTAPPAWPGTRAWFHCICQAN